MIPKSSLFHLKKKKKWQRIDVLKKKKIEKKKIRKRSKKNKRKKDYKEKEIQL